jgi:hypothetical protein
MELKQDETGKAIVPVLACVLKQLCDRNDRLPVSGKTISKFHAQRPPAITIADYLHRIAKYALCSGECFVLALVYIDRIIQQNPTFVVNSLNIHRLLITSVMLAAKFFDDQYFNNAYYAKVGGVPAGEMNTLEVEFLFMTNFSLFVTTDTYRQYYQELWNHANSSSACGCGGSRVPPLTLAFEAEEKLRRERVQVMLKRAEEEDDKPSEGDPPEMMMSDASPVRPAGSSASGSSAASVPAPLPAGPPASGPPSGPPQASAAPGGAPAPAPFVRSSSRPIDSVGGVPPPSAPKRSGRGGRSHQQMMLSGSPVSSAVGVG